MTPTLERIADAVLAAVRQQGRIGLYPHVGADGDALGSALGLALALKSAGASARIYVDEAVNPRLLFLPALELIQVYADLDAASWPADQALAIAIDCTEPERLGCRQELYRDAAVTAALDHHVSSGESGGLRLIDPEAAATGELIVDLIRELENRLGLPLLDREAATALMTAIVSDTGGFVYANTSARSFMAAAHLMSFGPDLNRITYRLFHETTRTRLRLTGRLFSDASFVLDGRLVYVLVGQDLLQSLGATDTDLDGIVAELRNVAGVEVALLFRELPDHLVRVSIRSNDSFHAADFARLFGGGGHPKAAGMTILLQSQSLEQIRDQVLHAAEQWLNG